MKFEMVAAVLATMLVALTGISGWASGAESPAMDLKPPDLTRATWLTPPAHAPIEIVREGEPRAVVYVGDASSASRAQRVEQGRQGWFKPGAHFKRLIDELLEVVRVSTGATLERVGQPPAADRPAIVIGDCEETRQAGIDPTKLPPEGFIIKTAPNRVYLVGSASNDDGAAWAVADFLERFVGVRWYWPAKAAGRSVPRRTSLVIPPVHYSDWPVFRQRLEFIETSLMPLNTPEGSNTGDRLPLPLAPGVMERDETRWYMPGMDALWRHGASLDFTPGIIHGSVSIAWWLTDWADKRDVEKAGEASRALNEDGTRHPRWICFSAPQTFQALIARLSRHWDEKAPGGPPHKIMTASSCTVYFPQAPGLVCHCSQCQETAGRLRKDVQLRAALEKQHGAARAAEILEERVHELVFGLFVQRLCQEVKQRWPGKKVVLNSYDHQPPQGVEFPDNLRVANVRPAGKWPSAMGQAMHPSVDRGFDDMVRRWGKVSIWASASSPGDWTYGPIQYPHLVQDFYLRNRRAILGSELGIFSAPILVSQAPTYYVWQRVLWNPQLDVDATLDEMCRRLFGPGAKSARELLRLQCDRWEKTPLSRPLHIEDLHRDQLPYGKGPAAPALAQEFRLPRDLFREIWPPDVVARMKELRDRALAEIERAGDADARRAFLYWTWTFDAFLEEAETAHRQIPADFAREAARAPLASVEGVPETTVLDLGGGAEMKLTLIRPGEFMMGSATNTWGHHRNEGPLHRVRITKPFYMGVCEVTRAQYDAVMGSNSAGDGPNRPASSVSWREATNFCGRASAKTGRCVRLPTEAEWEYACRAGTTTVWFFGDLDQLDMMKDYASYAEDARGGAKAKDVGPDDRLSFHPEDRGRAKTKDVGGRKPNAWGLHDTYGNVSEWCQDRFGEDYYFRSPVDNPSGPDTGIFRVIRGGSNDNLQRRKVECVRSARRAWGHPDIRGPHLGFRVVVETGQR